MRPILRKSDLRLAARADWRCNYHVVNLRHLGLTRVYSSRLEDRHESAAEGFKRLLGLPDVSDSQRIRIAVCDMR